MNTRLEGLNGFKNLQPIKTIFEGIEYRSRLEARWAVFFKRLNFKFEHEPFTVENNGLTWTPDFIVYEGFANPFRKPPLVEIKPVRPNEDYIKHLQDIRNPDESDILICVGDNPSLEQQDGILITNVVLNGETTVRENYPVPGFKCSRCPECGRYSINPINLKGYHCELFHNLKTSEHDEALKYSLAYRFDLVTPKSKPPKWSDNYNL